MKPLYRYAIAALIVLIALFVIANFWVSEKIKTRLAEVESLSYSSYYVNALTGIFTLEEVRFNDKARNIKIKEMELNVAIVPFLMNNKLVIERIDVNGMDLKIFNFSNIQPKALKKSNDFIIKKLQLKDAKIRLIDKGKITFEADQLNLKAENINWPLDKNHAWLSNETLEIDAKNLRYAMDTLHDLKSEAFGFYNKELTFSNFSIAPKFTKSDYVNHIQTEKDLMDLESKSLKISGFRLQKKDSLLHVLSRKIEMDSTNFDIYRDKTVKDDNSYKPLYSQALRELNFQLSIDSLLISELDITYEELIKHDRQPGKVRFKAIHAQVLNIHNTLNAEHPEIKAEAKARFTEDSEIVFHLNLVPDHEQFYVSTHLKKIEDKSINGFFAPAMRMEMDGEIDELKTSAYGNNTEMNGEFSLTYENMKVNILNKNGSKNSFASLMSNALISNKNAGQAHTLKNIERNTTKSFWNYLWTFHLKGLKHSLL